jgi:[FeFe] hydrogenase H-cluster maturation GTPase HydF
MQTTPKSMRLHIGLFGRTNVGKSSFLNYVAGQDVAVTSSIPGTTTDVVEKAMELLPAGPVVFLDTAGLDDSSGLSEQRLAKTRAVFSRADVFVLVVEPNTWTDFEDSVCAEAKKQGADCLAVVNKSDVAPCSPEFLKRVRNSAEGMLICSCRDAQQREAVADEFGKTIATLCERTLQRELPLVGDLVPPGGIAVLVVPIDLGAPKGRLIAPQVQTIRDALDNDAAVVVVKEREYSSFLTKLSVRPSLVVCDSQVVMKMVADTPDSVACTTFSILFSRSKGDLVTQAAGLGVIGSLRNSDRVLIAEACSHHALEDDIGRIKIPRWLRQFTGADLVVDVASGRDYPRNLRDYKLVVHCGSCMLSRRETLARIREATAAGVAITNYGLCISYLQGVIERVLEPFPAALDALRRATPHKGTKS